MFSNWLTRASAQTGLYSTVAFLSFIAVLNPVTRIGAGLVILAVFCYLSANTFKLMMAEYKQTQQFQKSFLIALSENQIDFCLFILFAIAGIFTALY